MTSKTKSTRLRRLLSHGFFAPELPPCFVSDDLAKFRNSILTAVSSLPLVKNRPAYEKFISEPCWFYFPAFGRDDRKHAVISPISYLLIAKVIADNFVSLRSRARRSAITASPPVFDWHGSRAFFRPSIDLRDDFRVALSARCERFVTADIRAFFHSIYTHAIPWAIYGKEWAKVHRSNDEYGNLLDLLCRNAQDGQTIGLPVGPDTSRFIAEIIASAVDVRLLELLNGSSRDASRYVDDYTVGCETGESGETIVAALRQAAAAFELELNNSKTAIVLTSARPDVGWKQAVKATIPKEPDVSHSEVQRFVYSVGSICRDHPDLNVEKYAFQNARKVFVQTDNWKVVQSHLINAYRRNPTLVSFLVEIIVLRKAERGDVDEDNLRRFLEGRLPTLARENRTGELIWFLFLSVRIGITLPSDCMTLLFKVENSMVALLVAVAASRGQIIGAVDFSEWNRSLTTAGLRGPMWLYAYEGTLQGIIPNAASAFIENDPYFSTLYQKRVSFLSIGRGFTSMSDTLSSRRLENARQHKLWDKLFDDMDAGGTVLEEDESDEESSEESADY